MAKFTQQQVDDMMERCLVPFRQDIVGDNVINITANTETRFAINGNGRNQSQSPEYMTDRWDTTNNIMTAVSEYDSPTYVADVGCIWTPAVNSEGIARLRLYINDTVPKLIRTYKISYKGGSPDPYNIITTWYWGSEIGYDAKNDGIYFTLEFEHDGTITSPSMTIYNTQ